MRHRLRIALAVLSLAAMGLLAWVAAAQPPLRMVWRYGLSLSPVPTGRTLTFEGVEFVEISPGGYRMGSNRGSNRDGVFGVIISICDLLEGNDPEVTGEMPVHWVEFPHGFWIARTEVTYRQYWTHKWTRESGSDLRPATDVTWFDAKGFCTWLAGRSGVKVRLPTESEWEVACRAGALTSRYFGETEDLLSHYAWYTKNSLDRWLLPVGSLMPNDLGLFDMQGNVREWCHEKIEYYRVPKPRGLSEDLPDVSKVGDNQLRVLRGGSFGNQSLLVRSANRARKPPTARVNNVGFRLARTYP